MLAYAAPEISEAKFSCAIDMWSFGCIPVEICIGKKLFNPLSEAELMYLIQETFGSIPGKKIEKKSNWEKPENIESLLENEEELFKDFVKKIMETDPKLRMTPSQALMHLWLC